MVSDIQLRLLDVGFPTFYITYCTSGSWRVDTANVVLNKYVNHAWRRIWKYTSCTQPADQGNDFELIPTVQVESQHSVGWPTCHDFPRFFNHFGQITAWSQKSLKTIAQKLPFRKKSFLTGKFSKMFSERIHADIEPRLVCKFREIWLAGNRQTRALFTGQKNSVRSPALASSRSRPISVMASWRQYTRVPQISSESVYFRRSYSRTREHRWNAPQVFPILGEEVSPSNCTLACKLDRFWESFTTRL